MPNDGAKYGTIGAFVFGRGEGEGGKLFEWPECVVDDDSNDDDDDNGDDDGGWCDDGSLCTRLYLSGGNLL